MAESIVRRVTWRGEDVARVLSLVALFVFAWQFFWRVYTAILLGLLAVLIAIVIHQPAKKLSRWLPFRLSFPLMVLLFVGSIVGLAVVLVPQLISQVGQLAAQLPATLDSVAAWLESKTGQPRGGPLSERINAQASGFAGRVVSMSFNVLSALLGSFAIVVLAIFLAAQPSLYRDLILRMAPAARRDAWTRVYDESGRSLRAWVMGKALTMLLVGIVTYVGLVLLKVPGALALAVFAALMEFVPNFGPTIAAIPAMIAGFSVSPPTALYIAVFYFLLQQVQNAITVPLIEQKAVNIPPAVLLIWQLMLTVGFGILALFVATPLLAVISVAVRILYLEPTEEREHWNRREQTAGPDTQPVLPLP